jgi:hypothetical protein
MTAARNLLCKLLEYIGEQTKDVDPRGYRLEASKYFLRRREDIAGLPGVEFDLNVAGDHIWLRVPRLEANTPPPLPEKQKGMFRISQDPNGPLPSLDEADFLHRLNKTLEGKTPEERSDNERRSNVIWPSITFGSPFWFGYQSRRKILGLV